MLTTVWVYWVIMVATDLCSGNCLFFSVSKTSEKLEGKCLCCIELRLELQKVKTEILSYEKIIKVLQEELYNKELLNKTEPSEQKDYSGDYFNVQPVKEEWVQVATKNYRKNNDFNSNLIKINPTTANRYELLSNLKDEETSNMSTEDVKIQNLQLLY
jgi:hypothetical protein